MKVKTIIIVALGIDGLFFCVSHYNTAKEIWDIIQVVREDTIEVKKEVTMSILIHGYELFRRKPKENIMDTEK